jgi:hypothetical protein
MPPVGLGCWRCVDKAFNRSELGRAGKAGPRHCLGGLVSQLPSCADNRCIQISDSFPGQQWNAVPALPSSNC